MAVDSKSQHVGNHGGRYIDNDGQSKQFTYIDHDKKPTISFHTEEVDKEWQGKYTKELVDRIMDIPASICPVEFQDFTVRGENQAVITWNKTMILDSGMDLGKLRDLCTILENRAEGMRLTV